MITFELNQVILRGGQRISLDLIDGVVRLVAKTVKKTKTYHVSIAFVSDAQMRRANKEYRGNDKVTDVLSFSLGPDSGELLFSYTQAKKQAKAMNHPVKQEFCFLLVHGLLHLFGYDHERRNDAKKMFSLQSDLLIKLRINPTMTYDKPLSTQKKF